MSDDIGPLLREWPYDDNEDLMVRRVTAPDGQARLQIRLELGILELHLSGRPDGDRPHGFESLLDFHLEQASREMNQDGRVSFRLDHDECAALQREAMQFYHRRVALLQLGEYEAAAADAEHNLAIMDLLRDHAADRNDWLSSEQYRAFVLNHWARARALRALELGAPDAAVEALDEGIDAIETLYRDDYQRPDLLDDSDDLRSLKQLRTSLVAEPERVGIRRESELERLQRELAAAVEREDYERAAQLRDALTSLLHRAHSAG